MRLTVEITKVETFPLTEDKDNFVEFSCFDGEDTMMVSFFGTMTQAHACFLVSKGINLNDAYGQMLLKIDNHGIISLKVGDKFESDDETN